MAMRYSVLELSTAVKPWLLRHLLARDRRSRHVPRPRHQDLRLARSGWTSSRARARRRADPAQPRADPARRAQAEPGRHHDRRASTTSATSRSLRGRRWTGLLDWWADRLRRDCRVDPAWGYFVDQRWFDLGARVPEPTSRSCATPQYNVAYWNLHSRRLERGGDGYLVDGRPLGLLPLQRLRLRPPAGAEPLPGPRRRARRSRLLEQILAEYAADVKRAGHAASQEVAIQLRRAGRRHDGSTTRCAGCTTSLSDEHDERGARRRSRSRGPGRSALARRAGARAHPRAVNRVLARLYQRRARPAGGLSRRRRARDRAGLLRWAQEYGRQEIPLLARR